MGGSRCRQGRHTVNEDGRPLFRQIVEQVESSIIDGSLAEETRAPSTNELAAFHRINPATAAKGINQLAADGILYKRRGIGMFVSAGAQDKIRQRRREQFAHEYVQPLLAEARRLGMSAEELKAMIENWEEQP